MIFESYGHAFKAFKNIGRGSKLFELKDGLVDYKLMGTGAGTGFSIWPDFKRYALLLFFDAKESIDNFIVKNEVFNWYIEHASQLLVTVLKPVKGHGKWAGVVPFRYDANSIDSKSPIAVITRATIHTKSLFDFWLNVPRVASFMHSAPALHQVGIGEYPIFMQATFSIWENLEALKNAAYKNTIHADVIRKTRERRWYKEELFAEFSVLQINARGSIFHKLQPMKIMPILK